MCILNSALQARTRSVFVNAPSQKQCGEKNKHKAASSQVFKYLSFEVFPAEAVAGIAEAARHLSILMTFDYCKSLFCADVRNDCTWRRRCIPAAEYRRQMPSRSNP